MDKEAIGLLRVQQFSHLCVVRPYQISVNSIFKHIHTTSINTIIWQFVPCLTSPHLSSSGPVAHKAKVHLLQLALSAATRLASFQLFHPSMRLSFSIVDHHVVFGQPTFLLPSGVQVNAVSHLLFLSIRRICPIHFHLLNLTSVLIVFNFVFARISRFDTTYGHRICRIHFKDLKKMYLSFCCLLR